MESDEDVARVGSEPYGPEAPQGRELTQEEVDAIRRLANQPHDWIVIPKGVN